MTGQISTWLPVPQAAPGGSRKFSVAEPAAPSQRTKPLAKQACQASGGNQDLPFEDMAAVDLIHATSVVAAPMRREHQARLEVSTARPVPPW